MTMNEKIYNLGLKCAVLISDFHEWQDRYLYVELIEDYLNYKLSFENFDEKFFFIWSANRDKEKSWPEFVNIMINFELNKFQGFSLLISKLFSDLEVCQPDISLREEYEISEGELRECVTKILLEIKKTYC